MPHDLNEKVKTGIFGLDEILLGGISRGNNILVEGEPGTGKTTLALGFIHAGATLFGDPGVIVSFELSPEKLLRDARGFNWEFEHLIAENRVRILQVSPAVLLEEFRNDDSFLMQELKAIGARRLMIDGLTPLRLYTEEHRLPFREDMHTLVETLTLSGITTLLTSERGHTSSPLHEHERYVCDTIISLSQEEQRRGSRRRLSIQKSRGQDFIGGSHAVTIQAGEGLRVHLRAQACLKESAFQPTSTDRMSTGIRELDTMMGGGLFGGSTTLVSGISGTGKTVAGLQFLCSAAEHGKKGLLVSLDEHPAQIVRNAAALDLPLQQYLDAGLIQIQYESPLELDLDVHYQHVTRLIESEDIECIVFDSVAVYELANPGEAAEFLYALASYCKGRLATVYFNYESPELLGVSQISEALKASHLVDNILLFSYVEISTLLRRALAVPKVRGSRNIQATREYVIGNRGIRIVDELEKVDDGDVVPVPQLPFSSYYGLLSRSPTRRSPAIDDAVFHGVTMPPSAPVLNPPQR